MSDVKIDAVHQPETWAEVFDETERGALALADAMSGETHSLEPELVTSLRALFTETELAELILVAGQANLNNRAGNTAKQLLGAEPTP